MTAACPAPPSIVHAGEEIYCPLSTVPSGDRSRRQRTSLGILTATIAWADQELRARCERREKKRHAAERVETNLVEQLTRDLIRPATEPHEAALLQEIRAWLRGLPELERLSQARTLAAKGDYTVLRAIVTAPTYLSGVDEKLLAEVKDEAIPDSIRTATPGWRRSGRPRWPPTGRSPASSDTSSRRRRSCRPEPASSSRRRSSRQSIRSSVGASERLRRRLSRRSSRCSASSQVA